MKKKRGFLTSLNLALEGIVQAFKIERNIRTHFAIALLVLLVSLFVDLSPLEVVLVFFAISFVLVSELFNFAIEEVLDMLTISHHEKAKLAKDVAAGAVLIACINALIVAYLILYFALIKKPFYMNVLAKIKTHKLNALVLLFAIILIGIIVIKTLGKKGTYIRGGLVSGHAALAFGASTAILLITRNLLATSLAFLIAILVAQSRVEAKIHKWLEVAIGALLGIGISLLIFYIF